MEWWQIILSILGGLLLLWCGLIAALWLSSRRSRDPVSLREVLRLAPDVVRLLRRLIADPTVPRGTRIWIGVLLGYLPLPIDLVPDFIPVIGYADDAIVVALVLRFATKHAGTEALDRHWPGSPQGLRALRALVGIRSSTAD